MRWGIEESFRECKDRLGMDEYETRSYLGWHRHMQFVMMAHLFMNLFRERYTKPYLRYNSDYHDDGSAQGTLRLPGIEAGVESAEPVISSCPESEPATLPAIPSEIQTRPLESDVVSLIIGNRRSHSYGTLVRHALLYTEYYKVLSFYNANDLMRATLTQDPLRIERSLENVKYDIKSYWASIQSYTRSYYREQWQAHAIPSHSV